MTDRLAEQGALQYAVENLATAGTNPNRLGLAGYIHAAYTDYQVWAAANPGVNPNRLSARGRLYGYFYDNGDPDAVIKALFANSEQGVFFDPSDLSTMFQDSAGSVAVTSDGQPVGLILDKSKGLVLASNYVKNATNWTNPTNGFAEFWSAAGLATGSIVDGTANGFSGNVQRVQNSSSGVYQGIAYPSLATEYPSAAGKTYKFTLKYRSNYPLKNARGTGFDFILPANTGAATTWSMYWSPTVNLDSTALRFLIGMDQSYPADGWCEIDEVSLQELPGNHASQATAAKRPLYKTSAGLHWLQFDGVDDALVTSVVDFSVTDKASIFAGVNKQNATNAHVVYCGTGNYGSVRCFGIQASLANVGKISGLLGDASTYSNPIYLHGFTEGVSFVSTSLMDLAGTTTNEQIKARHNGANDTITGHTVLTPGSTFTPSSSIYLGVGAIGGFPINGNIYSLIVLGRLATTQEIDDTEQWVAERTGVVLP